MKITPVVLQLRQRCPVFGGRVAGGIDFDAVKASQQVDRPGAFVIATGDDATDNDLQNGIRQDITDAFDVVVILDAKDQRGQLAVDVLHDIRAQLWLALVGWKPAAEYDPITYDGGDLVQIDRALVIYRYSFVTAFQLGRKLTTSQPKRGTNSNSTGSRVWRATTSTSTASTRQTAISNTPALMGALKYKSKRTCHEPHYRGAGQGPRGAGSGNRGAVAR
jgi:hypothetical protein